MRQLKQQVIALDIDEKMNEIMAMFDNIPEKYDINSF